MTTDGPHGAGSSEHVPSVPQPSTPPTSTTRPAPTSPPMLPTTHVVSLRTSKIAVSSMVLAVLGLCVPVLSLAAIVLGIVGIVQARPERGLSGRGIAIGGTVLGGVGILSSFFLFFVMLGVMLPALGAARGSARQLQAASQLRMLGQAIILYANDNSNALPPVGGWEQALTAHGSILPQMLVSPASDGVGPEYIYLGGAGLDFDANRIWAYEDPNHHPGGVLVLFADGRVEVLEREDFDARLAEQKGGAEGGDAGITEP